MFNFKGPWKLDSDDWVADDRVREQLGVYRLIAWDVSRDRPKTIPRAVGADKAGVLDIGMSVNLRSRLNALWACCRAEPDHLVLGHAAGVKYAAYKFREAFPFEHLRIEVLHLDDEQPVLADAVELTLLEHYLYEFKNLPPLNSTAGNWRKVERWLKSKGREARDAEEWIDLDGLLPEGLFAR